MNKFYRFPLELTNAAPVAMERGKTLATAVLMAGVVFREKLIREDSWLISGCVCRGRCANEVRHLERNFNG